MSYYDPYQNNNQPLMDHSFRQYYANEPSQDFLQPQYQQEAPPSFDYYNQINHELSTNNDNNRFLLSNDAPAPFFDGRVYHEERTSPQLNQGLYAPAQQIDQRQHQQQHQQQQQHQHQHQHQQQQQQQHQQQHQQQQWNGLQDTKNVFTQNTFNNSVQNPQTLDFMYGQSSQPVMAPQQQHSGASPDPSAPSRTVYLGNLPNDVEPNELLDYVRSGILENVKILPSKNCAFISFIDLQSALLFHSDCILKKLSIKGNDIRVGWGKNTPILPAIKDAIQKDGATRNVYLGNLHNPATDEMITEDELRADLSSYGVIDCIKIIHEKGIAFIHFLSILSAIRCVSNLPLEEKYLDKKCFYGKDRCAFITKTQQHNAAQYLGLAPGMEHVVTAADREFISSALVQQSAAAAQIATQAGGANNLGNRTVYLGNLHQESSVEEICNVVRGGLLQSIRFLKERHVCFITFIDPIAAAQFFAMCQLHGLTIHNRRIKVGWGKHSGPLSNALSLAVSNGASRNIYIGNINDFAYFNAQKLRDDFSTFGEIEQINYLEAKNCAFINFVNIANAIKAIDGIKSFKDYKTLKINFGKDRCGNLPRQFQNQAQNLVAESLDTRQFGNVNQAQFSRGTSASPDREYRE